MRAYAGAEERFFMLKKIHTLPKKQQRLYSLLISLSGMGTAIGISAACYDWASENAANTALLFILFLILISYNTAGYLYGIICSLLTVLWFNYRFTYPFFTLDFTLSGYPLTFLSMAAITVLISALTSRLTVQYNLMTEREHLLAEAEMEKMRANLLRAISHDLRTPLTGIIGNSLTYLENQEHLTEDEKTDVIRNIYEDSSWLINMVENLLTVTRIDSKNLTITTSEESLEEVVGEALQKMEKRHPGCVIHAKIPDDFIMLPMDAVLIEQVTINLLENALLHSGSAEPIDLVVENRPDEVAFTVRDYGQGIPKSMLNNLFCGAAYSTAEADVQKGMGIGLVICKTIISAHHGSITGCNHAHGAEFTFTLPKKKEERLSGEDRT